MIPKIIHYCWFGGNTLPEDAQRYIDSWKLYCPDYQIKEWNESNFNLNTYPYAKEAYDNKKYAFVTDIVRLYACYTEGGLYMDTDIEVIKKLDTFLKHKAVMGFESSSQISSGLMACQKGFTLFKELLDDYNGLRFVQPDGSFDLTTNCIRIKKTLLKHGFVPNGNFQMVEGLALYPYDYFCANNFEDGKVNVTDNTYTIHHFAGSWLPEEERIIMEFFRKMQQKFPRFIAMPITVVYGFFVRLKKTGIKKTLLHYKHQITGK